MSEEALNGHEEWSFKLNPWITMVPLMLSIFMYALDETISNVALPYMAGTFSVSHNESTWIITSYLVASGIAIPAVDFFSKLIGRKQYFNRFENNFLPYQNIYAVCAVYDAQRLVADFQSRICGIYQFAIRFS